MRSRWCPPLLGAKHLKNAQLWAAVADKVPSWRMGKKLIKSLYTFPCELLHTFAIVGERVLAPILSVHLEFYPQGC